MEKSITEAAGKPPHEESHLTAASAWLRRGRRCLHLRGKCGKPCILLGDVGGYGGMEWLAALGRSQFMTGHCPTMPPVAVGLLSSLQSACCLPGSCPMLRWDHKGFREEGTIEEDWPFISVPGMRPSAGGGVISAYLSFTSSWSKVVAAYQ